MRIALNMVSPTHGGGFHTYNSNILKGLLENPNCTDGIKSDITKKLEDENKYPVETDTYIIENWGCGEYTGGSMTVEEMADEVVEPFEEIFFTRLTTSSLSS